MLTVSEFLSPFVNVKWILKAQREIYGFLGEIRAEATKGDFFKSEKLLS